MKLSAIALVSALCLSTGIAFAAIPSKTPAPKPTKVLTGTGASTGGLAGSGFSLTNVALATMSKKERLILDIGDLTGAPVKGYPGYYHVELQENPRRVVIDLAQTPNIFIDEKTVQSRLKSSKYISSSSLLLDPSDQTLSLILNLKKDTKVQVFQVPGKKGPGRVVVDLL
jgi:hypothetical protein